MKIQGGKWWKVNYASSVIQENHEIMAHDGK
jgi:hypothetical protein